MKTSKKVGLKVKSAVRSGGFVINHNRVLLS